MLGNPSCLTQPVEKGPSKHKGHQAAKQIANPEVANWTEEEGASIAFCFEREDQQGDDGCSDKVEEEARKGFEAESASGDAEKRGSQGADVGDRLRGDVSTVNVS
jgi:hypothetical protein